MTDDIDAASDAEPVLPHETGDAENDTAEIRETDIVFDCPHCGHGLVIDYRGAGLIVTCTNCHKPVQVPIPAGMDISDLDQEPENLQRRISTLRAALEKAETHEHELEQKVLDLAETKGKLERLHKGQLHRLAEIRGACEHVQRVLKESSAILDRIFDMIQSEIR